MNSAGWRIDGPWSGTLCILPRPRGGDWLCDELANWVQSGIDVLVSLLEENEAAELDLRDERQAAATSGIELVNYPLPDRGVPSNTDTFDQTVNHVLDRLVSGSSIGIHCRQGIGRSSLVAIAVLVLAGRSALDAIDQVSLARGRPVPETLEQRQWLINWSQQLQIAG